MATLLNMELLVLIACALHMAAASGPFGCLSGIFGGKKSDAPPPKRSSITVDFKSPSVDAFNTNEEGMAKIMESIEKEYSDFIKDGLVYNSIDNYLRFYEAYKAAIKKDKSKTFSFFLENYNVEIQDNDEPVGNIMVLMSKIIDEKVVLKNHTYLISASPIEWKKYERDDNKYGNLWKPTFWTYEHVAGIIKFETNERVGYILLDPKYLMKPAVIMEDWQKAPFSHESLEVDAKSSDGHVKISSPPPRVPLYPEDHPTEDLEQKYNLSGIFPLFNTEQSNSKPEVNEDPTERNFIFGTYHDVLRKFSLDKDAAKKIIETNIVYLFKKPYVTYVKNTIKPSLLLPERTMKKLNHWNKMIAEVKVSGSKGNESFISFANPENIVENSESSWFYGEVFGQKEKSKYIILKNLMKENPPILKVKESGNSREDVEPNNDRMYRLCNVFEIYYGACESYCKKLILNFSGFSETFLKGAEKELREYKQRIQNRNFWDLV